MDELDKLGLQNLEPIDYGGQSKIFLGWMNRELQKEIPVIVKQLDYQNDKNLEKELRCKDLNHDNIIKVYDFKGLPKYHIVLEYSELGNLESFINNNYDKLKVNILDKIKGLINGIDYIHERKILHLDLHPKNILVTSKRESEIIFKICDFGLSEEEEQCPIFYEPIGRPGYVSPEKVTSKEITKSTDIWALGCILWKIFTTKESFDFDNPLAIYFKVGQYLHPDIPLNWPVQIQKILFYCWDIRCPTSKLLELFNIPRRNKKTECLLKNEMPLEYELRFIETDGQRIVPPIIWDCLNKIDKFSHYQLTSTETEKFKSAHNNYLCLRKLKKIETSMDLLKYLNECGYFKNLKELNEKLINSVEMRKKLFEAIEKNKWIPVARSLGMPDKDIDEFKNQNSEEILNEIFEFWSEETKQYAFTLSGLLQIFQYIHLDFD